MLQGAEVCLADYCDVLHCDADSMMVAKHEQLKACKPSEMSKRRHRCEAVGHRCFPPEDGANMAHLHGECSAAEVRPMFFRTAIGRTPSHPGLTMASPATHAVFWLVLRRARVIASPPPPTLVRRGAIRLKRLPRRRFLHAPILRRAHVLLRSSAVPSRQGARPRQCGLRLATKGVHLGVSEQR